MECKVFRDIVHGHMVFHPLLVSIIDTPQFQRLRHLKQVGAVCFVYPTATQTRFEHSLGTCFLAGKLMDVLYAKCGGAECGEGLAEERRREKLSVQIAALCHDLGHGPFSHSWEFFLQRCGVKWNHEESSIEIFDEILREYVADHENEGEEVSVRELFRRHGVEDHIEDIKKMIYPKKGEGFREKAYLYQIVNNKSNGIDVDKWDYLLRDSRMVNMPINFDCGRIFQYCQILETNNGNNEICFRDKECGVLIKMFETRRMMHHDVYQHRKVKVIEEMLLDAFYYAKDRLKLTSTTPSSLLKLTDHIYQKILYEDFVEEDMIRAKNVLKRLERRRLYICIASKEFSLPKLERRSEIEEKMFEVLREGDKELERNHISSILISLNGTKTNRNVPLKNVKVHGKKRPGESLRGEDIDWSQFPFGLQRDLKNLNCFILLILYKGDNRTRYKEDAYNSLLNEIWTKVLPPESERS